MPDVEPAALLHEALEPRTHRLRPCRTAIDVVAVLDDDVVVLEAGIPLIPTRRRGSRRRGRYVNGEVAGTIQDRADVVCREAPIVIAEAIDDEHADGFLRLIR